MQHDQFECERAMHSKAQDGMQARLLEALRLVEEAESHTAAATPVQLELRQATTERAAFARELELLRASNSEQDALITTARVAEQRAGMLAYASVC